MSITLGQGIKVGNGILMSTLPPYVTDGLVEYLDATSYGGMGPTWPPVSIDYGSDATLEGSPYPTYTAASPTYLNFNPADGQYATVPGLGDLNSWTVEAWFSPTADLSAVGNDGLTTVVTTVYKEPGQPHVGNINFCLTNYNGVNGTPNNGIAVGFYNSIPGGGWHLTSYLPTTPGTWYSVTGTYDGTTLSQYNNGALGDSLAVGQTSAAGGGNIRLARRWDGETNNSIWLFPGDIAIVRIYNTALSADQVAQNFNATRTRFGL